jgi:hypothetical protein
MLMILLTDLSKGQMVFGLPVIHTPKIFLGIIRKEHPTAVIRIRPHVFYLLVYGTADLEFWDIRKK